MTIAFQKERMTAADADGNPIGYIDFPQIRPGLVNITQVSVLPSFRSRGAEDSMMEALLTHLTAQGKKAALTDPCAQQYVSRHEKWTHILPGQIRCVVH